MNTASYSALLVSRSGSVLEVTLNRPNVRNALDLTLIGELERCASGETAPGTTRALVLRGAGESFCAGADLNWMARAADYTYQENLEDARALQRMLAAIAHYPGVTIAVVHGAAIGGGAGIVAACDIVIAIDPIVFAFSEVRLGLVPAIIAPYVVEKVGAGAARSRFVTGERFDGAEALRMGLVQSVAASAADANQLLLKYLAQVLLSSPGAVAEAKQLIREISGRTAEKSADLTAECIARIRVSAEGQEGIRAFLEKRAPSFAEAVPLMASPANDPRTS